MCQFLFKQRSKGADWEAANTAMANAAQVMETVLDTYTTGHAGILVRPSADQDSAQAKAEIERALADLPASEARWDVALDTAETPHPLGHRQRFRPARRRQRHPPHRQSARRHGTRPARPRDGLRLHLERPQGLLGLPAAHKGVHALCARRRPGSAGAGSFAGVAHGAGHPAGYPHVQGHQAVVPHLGNAVLAPQRAPFFSLRRAHRISHASSTGTRISPLHHGNGVATTTNTTRSGAAPKPASRMIPIRVTSFIAT